MIMYTCCIFNPFFVNENIIVTIELLIVDLTYFVDGFSNMFVNNSFICTENERWGSILSSSVCFSYHTNTCDFDSSTRTFFTNVTPGHFLYHVTFE